MPRKSISFELDFMTKDILPKFTVKQFDDVSFNIKPKKQGLDYDTTGMTGKIFIGVNNDMFMQTKNITVSNNNVNILLDRNMLQKNGRAYAEVELTDSNGTITSSSFIFNIDEKIGEGAKIPGEYEGFVAKYERLISEFKTQVNSTINNCNTQINSTINNCNASVNNKLNTVDSFVDTKISELENRFNALTSKQQQDAEVIDARDGETSLKARLDRDIEKAKQVYVNVEGSNISTDSSSGYLKDVEIKGNTIQDTSNLADIKSVGDKVEGQELYEIPVLCTNGLDSKDSEYQEDKITILSPTPLEKVGDVADRIIEKDGVWGVEKNVITYHLKDFTHSNFNSFACRTVLPILGIAQNNYTTIPFYSNLDYAHTNVNVQWNDRKKNTIALSKERINSQDVYVCDITSENYVFADIVKMIEDNDIWVKYALLEPQFIPLPHDQQVKLRTFANKTNISFLTEIEGIIKAQVPKSLGATVNTHTTQIDNLNKELDRVKKLEESTVSTVTTESDFTTVEATSNGYFEDVKLEGKTLVNIVKNTPWNTSGTMAHMNVDWSLLKPSTDYTFILCNPPKNTKLSIVYVGENFTNLYNDASKPVLLRTKDILPSGGTQQPHIYSINDNSFDSIELQNTKIVVLEGDHTQNPPSYFEGLKSVGQDVDEIVVSSVNSFISQDLKTTIESSRISHKINPIKEDFNIINPYTSILNVVVFEGDNWVKDIQVGVGRHSIELLENECVKYINQYFENGWTSADVDSIKNIGIYTKQDKKRLLYYNNETQTWEKPVLREWDSIEKHANGKYYYHQRSGEVVVNGSEDWVTTGSADEDTLLFYMEFNAKPCDIYYARKCISDKINSSDIDLGSKNIEGIYTAHDGNICIRISKAKLPTQDVAGFKQWLQANNVTVVYQLAEEKVYECTNIDLITYANETNYIVESGAIVPRSTLKVHNNISNVVSLLQKKVSLLESNITRYTITQNRLMLTSRYNADTVGFKVDVATLRNSFEYDNDLYELILNNILVGKDNYDREYIENLIIFYWMDFVISDEMHSALFEIIEEQHNPKVIEDEEAPL